MENAPAPSDLDGRRPPADNGGVNAAVRPLVYLLLAVGLTWPAAIRPVAAVPGSPRGDLWDGLWSFWAFADRVGGGRSPFRVDGLLNHPDGGSIWFADPLGALLLLPLVPLVGVAAAWTVAVLAHLVFLGLVGHALGDAVGQGRPGAGWVAGVLLAASPMMLSQIHNGATEAVGGGWLVLAALRLHRLRESPSAPNAAWAGLALGLAGVAHWYAAVGGALLLALFVGASVRSVATARAWALAAALALVAVAPAGLAAAAVTRAEDGVVGIKSARELATVRRTIGPADPVGYLHPGDYRSPDFRELARYDEDYVHCHYLGWVGLLAALGALRRREGTGVWWAALGVGAVLAMGPVLARGGAPVILPGRLAIPLPYLLLEPLPGFRDLSLVYRLAWLAVVALAALAARGAGGRFAPLWAVALVVETRLWSPAAGLPAHADARPAAPLLVLAEAPPGAVMNFPVVGGRAYLYEQTVHRHPLAASLNFPNNAAARRVWAAAMDRLDAPPDVLRAAVVAAARREGVRYLVIHDDPLARPDTHDAAARALAGVLPVLAEGDGMRVLRID